MLHRWPYIRKTSQHVMEGNMKIALGSLFLLLLLAITSAQQCRDGMSTCPNFIASCNRGLVRTQCRLTCGVCTPDDWGDWSAWSCDVTCNVGTETRFRACLGTNCLGVPFESRSCSRPPCDPTGVWGEWSAWICNVACGTGTETRTRSCLGTGCSGQASESQACTRAPCVPDCVDDRGSWCNGFAAYCKISASVKNGCKQTCNLCEGPSGPVRWGDWGPWVCDVTCGTGTETRTRQCLGTGCVGDASESRSCTLGACPSIADWSACSRTCGGGSRHRYTCELGLCDFRFEACNTQPCPLAVCLPLLNHLYRYRTLRSCCRATHVPFGENCGKPVDTDRIIGGIDATAKDWPWMVAITGTGITGTGLCGGSIISTTFVLTAAHCLADRITRIKYDKTKMKVYPGMLRLTEAGRFPWETATVKETIFHPLYNDRVADIGLVELHSSLTFSEYVHPICLPWGEETPIDETCYVTGWGVSTISGTATNRLQVLDIKNLDTRACIDAFSKENSVKQFLPFLRSDRGYLCAGSLYRPVDSCTGDSGGPIVCQRCKSCSWYVSGIVSFGTSQCAVPGVPAIYTKVHFYEDWIIQTARLRNHYLACSSS